MAEIKVAVEPLSDKEFIYYAFDDDDVKIDAVISVGKLLDEIKDTPHKNALRNSVADFIIDELVTDRVTKKVFTFWYSVHKCIENVNALSIGLQHCLKGEV